MYNCFRENKNKYILGYLSYLIKIKLFNEVIINFLPIGHTHNDADQLFSVLSHGFNNHNAFTIDYMHKIFKITLENNLLCSFHIQNFPDISNYFIDENILNEIHGIFINIYY